MAKTSKRKVSYNSMYLQIGEASLGCYEQLTKMLAFLLSKQELERKWDMPNDRFAFLASMEQENTNGYISVRLLFKSAKHSYRAPLLDKDTVQERDNPKHMNEGERMNTHALIKFSEGEAIVFLEVGQNVLTCNNIVQYFNQFIPLYNSQFDENSDDRIEGKFAFDMIASDDFRTELAKMNRAVTAEIFTDKEILGDTLLNYSQPSAQMKELVTITIKAEREQSILEHVYDFVDKIGGANSTIRRVRVRGKLNNGNDGIIDTNFLGKKEWIDAQQNKDTGEYNSVFMFSQLASLANDY